LVIKTNRQRVNRALQFANSSNIFFGIGKTTPWEPDDYLDPNKVPSDPESYPPDPDPSASELKETIGFKKAEKIYFVVPYNGQALKPSDIVIDYVSTKWLVVPQETALQDFVNHVYIETNIYSADLPLGEYRQIGVFTGLTPSEDVPDGKIVLLPTEVSDVGVLEVLDNRQKTTRLENSKETLSYILKF